MSGIPIHADFAAVNVNFWVTPDEANLDEDSGGLIVWNKRMPPDWELWRYKDDIPAIREFLSNSRAKSLDVPYRQNRAVMFNSDLFHETGRLNFRDGYENRRINVTMLFGQRESGRALSKRHVVILAHVGTHSGELFSRETLFREQQHWPAILEKSAWTSRKSGLGPWLGASFSTNFMTQLG